MSVAITNATFFDGCVRAHPGAIFATLPEYVGGWIGEVDVRKFIRHPTDFPIEYWLKTDRRPALCPMRNLGGGGLCFEGMTAVNPGATIHLRIVCREGAPALEEDAIVVWCRPVNGRYMIGVRFEGDETCFRVRNIEQVCHIEHYRRKVRREEGRELTSQEAAAEWIVQFASQFPDCH